MNKKYPYEEFWVYKDKIHTTLDVGYIKEIFKSNDGFQHGNLMNMIICLIIKGLNKTKDVDLVIDYISDFFFNIEEYDSFIKIDVTKLKKAIAYVKNNIKSDYIYDCNVDDVKFSDNIIVLRSKKKP